MYTNKQTHLLKDFLHKEKFSLSLFFLFFLLAGPTSLWSLTAGLLFLLVYNLLIRGVSISRYFCLEFFLLFLSSLFAFFTCISNNFSVLYSLKFPVPMVCAYLLGRLYADRYRSEEVFVFVILFMAISLGIMHMIYTINDILIVGLLNPERTLETLGDIQRATTQRTTELSLCLACFCMFFIPRDELKVSYLKNIYIFVASIATLCVLHYVSRTGVALVIITFIIGLIYRWGGSRKTLFLILLFLTFFFIIQNTDLYQLYSSRETDVSNLKNAGLRTERWNWGIDYLLNNPWGNVSTGEYRLEFYAHNFWLDYGIAYGLFAALSIALFSLRIMFKTMRYIRNKNLSENISLVILTFSIVFVLCLFTEPIIYGAPNYMMMYLMFCGFVGKAYVSK